MDEMLAKYIQDYQTTKKNNLTQIMTFHSMLSATKKFCHLRNLFYIVKDNFFKCRRKLLQITDEEVGPGLVVRAMRWH
jgi:hypothetical protein